MQAESVARAFPTIDCELRRFRLSAAARKECDMEVSKQPKDERGRPYEAPAIESVITDDTLDREASYAGGVSGSGISDN